MAEKKTTSVVWKYFELIERDKKQFTQCQLCKAILAYHSGTSSMRTHLTHRHKSLSLDASVKQLSLAPFIKALRPKLPYASLGGHFRRRI